MMATVLVLDTDKILTKSLCDFGWVQVSGTVIRLIGPYDDSVGL
jgi:hypothetical protein